MVICLERGADLHTAQLMLLPLTVSCINKIQIGFTFMVLAYPGSTGKGPLNVCVRACVCGYVLWLEIDHIASNAFSIRNVLYRDLLPIGCRTMPHA